jgi:hypothetical protein
MVLTSRERASELSRDRAIEIRVLGFGQARARASWRRQQFQRRAAWPVSCKKSSDETHNPFAVKDIYLRADGYPRKLHNYGCSLIFGHPQGPSGAPGVGVIKNSLAEVATGSSLAALLAIQARPSPCAWTCIKGQSCMAVMLMKSRFFLPGSAR